MQQNIWRYLNAKPLSCLFVCPFDICAFSKAANNSSFSQNLPQYVCQLARIVCAKNLILNLKELN